MSRKKTVDENMAKEAEDKNACDTGEDMGMAAKGAGNEDPAAQASSENIEEPGKEAEGAAGKTPEAKDEKEDDTNSRYLRLAADFQNYKRRTEKEKCDIYAYANEKLVIELLHVIDNFERALGCDTAADSFAEGMGMILKQLQGLLEKNGVEEIKALGEAFDPNVHHAVMTEPSDKHECGCVIEVLQKGYLLNNKVIRPAMVKVAE